MKPFVILKPLPRDVFDAALFRYLISCCDGSAHVVCFLFWAAVLCDGFAFKAVAAGYNWRDHARGLC